MGSTRAGSNPAGVARFVALGRLWSRGYDVRFPTVRPGFESRRAQWWQDDAFLAEWSKALDLSSSIRKNAQVRTLQKALVFALSCSEAASALMGLKRLDRKQCPRGLMDKA